MSHEISLRPATVSDVPEILRQRCEMYQDMGPASPAELNAMVSSSEVYLRCALAEGSVRAWLAITPEGRPVGGGMVSVAPRLSRPYFPECREASILNVYVYPEFRRQGIARRLMQAMIDWCRAEGFPHVSLHASKDGRTLYESLGFQPSSEMRLKLR
jgi:GNAT superfamily N-acetyltransferase